MTRFIGEKMTALLTSPLFDVHTHHPEKTTAEAGGIPSHSFVASGFNRESNEEVIAFSRAHGCLFSLGIGPQEIQRTEKYPDLEGAISEVEKQLAGVHADPALSRRFVAVGEVGLDKHWGKTTEDRERQFFAFERMISLAGKLGRPLVIHSRDAENECFRQLHAAHCEKVIMHCFGGKLEEAKRCADAGWLISIPPQANSERKKIIKALGISSLVIESDAPYIGKMSADALKSAEMISRYKEMKLEDVLGATAGNARNFFCIGSDAR